MPTQRFTKKRVTGITHVAEGIGSYTVDILFVPNFIDVTFFDIKHKPTKDEAGFALAVIPGGYQLTINYHVHEPRSIRHVVAYLPVDPEMTISN